MLPPGYPQLSSGCRIADSKNFLEFTRRCPQAYRVISTSVEKLVTCIPLASSELSDCHTISTFSFFTFTLCSFCTSALQSLCVCDKVVFSQSPCSTLLFICVVRMICSSDPPAPSLQVQWAAAAAVQPPMASQVSLLQIITLEMFQVLLSPEDEMSAVFCMSTFCR